MSRTTMFAVFLAGLGVMPTALEARPLTFNAATQVRNGPYGPYVHVPTHYPCHRRPWTCMNAVSKVPYSFSHQHPRLRPEHR
jgi:hypothetical protein